jgi:hypothetical protein
MDGESTSPEVQSGPSAGMMLKAKMAPHLLHEHEWESMAGQIQPKRLFDGNGAGAAPGPMTGMRPVVSATDGPVAPQYQQPTSPGQQKSIAEERSARMDPNKTKQPGYNPMNANGTAKITQPAAAGAPAGGTAMPARRESTNPMTGDQGKLNRNASGPVSGGALGGGPSFTNPTSKGIYDSHVRTLFSQPSSAKVTPLRRPIAPAL